MAKAVLKWAGGKSTMLPELEKLIKPHLNGSNTYYEPFIGGGSAAFSFEYPNTVINDLNSELMNVYQMIKIFPNELILKLEQFQSEHSEEKYYEIRAWDKLPNFDSLDPVDRAARFIYINKTGFNGLYRVNSKGYCNTPIGRTSSGKTPDIVQKEKVYELARVLQPVTIRNQDVLTALSDCNPGDVVFLDPPYDYEDEKGFVGYQKEGFDRTALSALKVYCDSLVALGVKVVLTNNDTTFVRELFKDWNFKVVPMRRSINSKASGRGPVNEVIIYSNNIC
jgi:DNA adenine methylase